MLACGFTCARRRGVEGKPRLYMSIIFKRQGPYCFNKTFLPEGELDQYSGFLQDTHHMRNWGMVGDWGGMRTAGGHLRLFKQISEEYQSQRTLREMLLVCSPAAEAFISP